MIGRIISLDEEANRERRGLLYVRVEGKRVVVVCSSERGILMAFCCLGVYSEAFKGKKKNFATSRVFYMYTRHYFSKFQSALNLKPWSIMHLVCLS